ncbi:MAG: oligosaccharide flippase family protein [Paracoccaceae bacterium]|nr:oligosaccharide flippase family protein [Paracoccaceae bacterium]
MTGLARPAPAGAFAPHPSAGRSRAAVAGTLWSLLQALLPSLGATIVFFVGAAFLAPADFGHLAIATAVVSVAIALSPMAFGEALVQKAKLDPSHADAVFWLNAVFAAGYAGTLLVAAPSAARWFDVPDLAWILPLLTLRVPFELLAAVPSAMIVRRMAFRLLALRSAVGAAVGMAVSLALLLGGQGLLALVIGQVAASATGFLVAVWTAGWWPGRAGRARHLRELAHYGIFSSGQRVLSMVRLDHLVLGALGGATLLGLLVFAQRIFVSLSSLGSGALGQVTHVVLSSMQDEPEKARRAFLLISFAAAAIGFPVFAGAAMVVDDIVRLYFAENWSGAAAAAQILCLAGLLSTPGIVQAALIRSRGHADWLFYYQLAQESASVLAIALTFRFGIEAVVTAIVLKTLLIWPVSVAICLRLLACPLAEYARSFAAPAVATLGMVAALALLQPIAGGGGLVLHVTTGAAAYAPVAAVLARHRLAEARSLLRRQPKDSP